MAISRKKKKGMKEKEKNVKMDKQRKESLGIWASEKGIAEGIHKKQIVIPRRKYPVKKEFIALISAIIVVFFIGLLSGILFLSKAEITGKTSIELNPLQNGEKLKAEINIAAVSNLGEGVLSKAVVEIIDGEGRVLFNTNPFVEPDTQLSVDIAKAYAEKFTGKSLAKKDVIYSIEDVQAKLVGGASAGAALTLATIAAIEGKKIKKDVVITGTILKNGTIGQIAGVVEKAYACAEKGIKLFLVPVGQAKGRIYEQKIEEKKGPGYIFQTITYVPKQIDLNSVMFKQYGMQVVEVANISQAVNYLIE